MNNNTHIFGRRVNGYITFLLLSIGWHCAAVNAAQPGIYQPITAQALYEGIMNGGFAPWVKDPGQRTVLSTLAATSFVVGVADSTQGKQWCSPKRLEIQSLTGTVIDYLADLVETHPSEDAALIVKNALAREYPCSN